jgi:hypothetical protein
MKEIKTKIKTASAIAFTTLFLSSADLYSSVQAVCGPNTVPNPLDPNCEGGRNLLLGTVLNRFIQFIPFIITIAAVIAIIRGAIKIMFADDAEARGEGFKIVINAAIGAAVFYSLWILLFFLEVATGGSLLNVF